MVTIQQVHTYQKLVDEGILDPILCLEGHKMLPYVMHGAPVYICVHCNQTKLLGQEFLDMIDSVC